MRGGGGLALVDHLAEFLGRQPGDISGNWDMGHKMQLAFGDVFLKDVTYKRNMRVVYNLMKKYKDGKGGLIFKEGSEKLLHAVLKNKGKQDTRWVRADLRGKQAYFRNAPTFYELLCTELRTHEANNDLAAKKKCKALIKSLKNGKHWALMIGYSQLLEIYSATSLDA